LTSSSSSLNKKLAHFQKQSASLGSGLMIQNSNSIRFTSEFGSNKLASFSYDLRLDTSFYQTLENYLFVK
jgi:hypothetical protein